tara:strand:+ start:44 stop:2251 length:2208 start_codon:yes stop_codon:yes gene_type:complete
MSLKTLQNLNEQQENRIFDMLGYKGPKTKQAKQQYLASNQAARLAYNSILSQITNKRQSRLMQTREANTVPTMAQGGLTYDELYQNVLGRKADPGAEDFYKGEGGYGKTLDASEVDLFIQGARNAGEDVRPLNQEKVNELKRRAAKNVKDDVAKPDTPVVEAKKIEFKPEQDVTYTDIEGAGKATAVKADRAEAVAPDARDAVKVDPTKTQEAVGEELDKVSAVQGEVSQDAKVQAQTVDATATAVKNVQEAQLDKAVQIDNIPKRKLEAEELVNGASVKSAIVEQNLDKFQAAQADLDPMATIQGQLGVLTKDFDVNNPPSWAAGAVRSATAILNQRGLGASSVAGQAVIQAVMESAIPIAQVDAATTANLNLANLSNRQQRAVVAAQQRATFLGQEFDQDFQARVANAARISDIANQNFNAEVQVTLENARMAQSVDLANLNNKQARIMAEAAQIANLETANLNNRQQAAVQNANAFLQMDMTNLQFEQQTHLFKAQEQIKSLLTDAAAENAAKQFNATSENQVNQFYDSLSSEIARFNTQQYNAMEQFNASQEMAIDQFNIQQENAVAQFNAQNGLVVSQANAQWRRQIATGDTAAINQVNQLNAQSALAMSIREYEGLWQEKRDQMQFAFNSAESLLDRENELAKIAISANATIKGAKYTMAGNVGGSLGEAAIHYFGTKYQASQAANNARNNSQANSVVVSNVSLSSTPSAIDDNTTIGPGGGSTTGVLE